MEGKRHESQVRRPRVLITRPEREATVFAEMVGAAGFSPVLSPALRIVFATRPVSLVGVAALAFTSANGVHALLAAPAPGMRPTDLRAFAIGEATAAAAREAGFANVAVAAGEAGSLAALIAATLPPGAGEVLHVTGRDRAGDLVGMLNSRGVAARCETLYEAVPEAGLSASAMAVLSKPAPADWATFFSARTARVFLEQASAANLTDGLASIRAACLSSAVAEAARAARWRSVEVAAEPRARALMDLMRRKTPGGVLEGLSEDA